MDWNFAIDKHREALKNVLAMLVAMAGLFGGTAFKGEVEPGSPTLPRHLHRAVLRLLRPAESAVRRLVIVAARRLTVPPRREAATPPCKRKRKPASAFLKKPGGTGILLPRAMLKLAPRPAPRALALPLFDRLPRWESRPRRLVANSVPRVLSLGSGARFAVVERRPPLSPGDPLDAGRLHRRLAALAAALDDLPRAARRFARWRACRDAASVQNPGAGVRARKPRRLWPMRPGRPPGWRAPGSRHASAVHETLNDLHGLAFWALEQSRQKRTELSDTS
jgi:hypothetical protein